MNIAIDVLSILGPGSKNRGIGNYSISQFKKIFEFDRTNNYFLLNFYEETSLKEMLNYGDNVKEIYFYSGPGNFLVANSAYKEVVGSLVKKFILEYKIEEFYITSPFDNHLFFEMEWFEGTKTIATVYDIIPYIFQKRYLAEKEHYTNYMDRANKLKHFDKLLVISQSVKDDLIHYLSIDPNKIEVIMAGVDSCYVPSEIGQEGKELLRQRYGILDKFIMCTGGDDDRKNIAGLIEAFSNLPHRLKDEFQLVIACKLSKESEQKYIELAKRLNIKERVIFTNYVPLEDLIILYNAAYVMAFPSQYEGFGLPVVEAMACGTPVITSKNSSLGEIAEDAAVLVDPFDIKDITRGLLDLLDGKVDINYLVEQGYKRVKSYSWDKVSLTSIKVFNELYSETEFSKVNDKKHIAFFTPLPPLQSGIADYSVDILNSLTEYFYIDVYIDENYRVSTKFDLDIEIYTHKKFEVNKHKYENIIYQMGNSKYHSYMIPYIQKYKGIVVLHDSNLHGLMYSFVAEKDGFEKYKRFLYEDYDREFINQYVNDLKNGKSPLREADLPSNGLVTNYAKKVIVHSEYANRELIKKDINKNVIKIQSYSKIEPIVDKKKVKEEMNIPNKVIISAFGHIHQTKRILPALKAFKRLGENYSELALHLVGTPAESIKKELFQFIKEHNLEKQVLVTGYTDLSTFERYIDMADICLNLRYPYNGETSGSLMRILSKGKVAVVNNIGSFAEIPDDCSVKIPSPESMTEEEEVEQIYDALHKLINDKHWAVKIASNARKFAEEELDIKLIERKYFKAITSTYTPSLNEEVIDLLINDSAYNEMNDEDLHKLSKTLAYIKNQKV